MRPLPFFLYAVPCTLYALFLASCGSPSYPKDRLVPSLVGLCRSEYHVSVQAALQETTIGVLLPLENLFEGYPSEVAEEQFEAIAQTLPFSKSALEKIEVVSRALSRVVLSTDAPLEFYTVVTRDVVAGVEFLWSGYITDLKRLNYLDISQGDFLRYRTPITLRIEPARLAKRSVEAFLEDLLTRPTGQVLRERVSTSARLNRVLPLMLELRAQLLMSSLDWRTSVEELLALPLSSKEVLVHVRGKATVGLPSYLILVEVSEYRGVIREITKLRDPGILPAGYEMLGPVQTWENRFVIEAFSLPQFLADQIARRTRVDWTSQTDATSSHALMVGGSYRDNTFKFRFHYFDFSRLKEEDTLPRPEDISVESSEKLASTIVQTAAEVLHSYRFTDFKNLTVIDGLKGTQWVLTPKELSLYRRRNPPALRPLP